MQDLKGKIALVTGVGRREGIGAAICRELANRGGDVFYTYWSQYDKELFSESAVQSPANFAQEFATHGVRAQGAEIDLSQPDAPQRLFAAATEAFGTPDILINNACYDKPVPFEELSAEILDAHYAINVRAVTLLCKEFIAAWKKEKGGRIINMTSGQAVSQMGADKTPYTTTKAAIEMLAVQLAPELAAKGITINAFDPGPTDTGWMTEDIKKEVLKDSKKGTITMPEEIGKLIAALLTDSSEPTGQIIHAPR